MAATKTRAATKAGPTQAANGSSASSALSKAKGPMLTAGATAAGLAGGYVLGSRARSKRKNGVVRTAKALGHVARELSSASNRVSAATGEVRQVREELEKTTRRSPVEVLLDGLTHRRGAHKRES
jgi:hypothetical protein